jgi:hypothetical protein
MIDGVEAPYILPSNQSSNSLLDEDTAPYPSKDGAGARRKRRFQEYQDNTWNTMFGHFLE